MYRRRSTRQAPSALPCALLGLALALVGGAPWAHASGPAGGDTLDPAHTWTVIAGVLSWKEPKLPSFSPYHRRDQALDAVFAARGVPDAQRTLLLDDAATATALKAALKRAVAKVGPEDTLVFYFEGHGMLFPSGKVIFATSETRARVKSGLHLDEVPALFRGFRGKRVILLADCCHSGGLQAVGAALVKRGIDAVTLTSATQSKISTANWTFTQALIDCLGGSPLCDANGDNSITLDEVRGESSITMLHREQQKIGWADPRGLGGLVVAETRHDDPALAPGQPRRGEWVAVAHRGRPWAARVLGTDGDALIVSVYDYSDEVRLRVPAAQAHPIDLEQRWKVGATIDVAYEGVAYIAKVEKVDRFLCYVSYPGYPSWNEWVGPDRIVGAHAAGGPAQYPLKPAAAAGVTAAPAAPAAGKVLIEWRGSWYPGSVIGEKDGKRCVHYDGWAAEWDECVPPERVRAVGEE